MHIHLGLCSRENNHRPRASFLVNDGELRQATGSIRCAQIHNDRICASRHRHEAAERARRPYACDLKVFHRTPLRESIQIGVDIMTIDAQDADLRPRPQSWRAFSANTLIVAARICGRRCLLLSRPRSDQSVLTKEAERARAVTENCFGDVEKGAEAPPVPAFRRAQAIKRLNKRAVDLANQMRASHTSVTPIIVPLNKAVLEI